MTNSNYAEGYDVLTGEVDMNNPCNSKYGKMHTCDAWLPTRNRYYAVTKQPTMPVALIVFGDKSHTDLYGPLSLTPIIFTLGMIHSEPQENNDDVQVLLSGQYVINVTQAVINEMQTEHTITVAWLMENTDKNNNQKYNLSKDLVRCLHKKIIHSEEAIARLLDTQEPL